MIDQYLAPKIQPDSAGSSDEMMEWSRAYTEFERRTEHLPKVVRFLLDRDSSLGRGVGAVAALGVEAVEEARDRFIKVRT